jgi:hypothetical protein
VRERRSDPRVVPGFRYPFRPDMPPSLTPGSSIVVSVQNTDVDIGLRHGPKGSALPIFPQSVSRGARFRGYSGSQLLRPVRLLAPRYGPDRSPGQRGLLLPGFQRVGRPSAVRRLIHGTLSHELCSPLAGIRGSASVLAANWPNSSESSDDQIQIKSDAHGGTQRMGPGILNPRIA